jgi:hypothetical protein
LAQLGIRGDLDKARQTDTAAFTRDDGRIAIVRRGKALHHSDRFLVLDRHERIGDARKDPPRDKGGLIAFEHRHDGRFAIWHLDDVAGPRTLEQARGSRGVDDDEIRTVVSKQNGEVTVPTAAAMPPTPACTKTWEGSFGSLRKVSLRSAV